MHLIGERCALGSKNRFKNKEGNKEPLTSSALKGKRSAQQNKQKKKISLKHILMRLQNPKTKENLQKAFRERETERKSLSTVL